MKTMTSTSRVYLGRTRAFEDQYVVKNTENQIGRIKVQHLSNFTSAEMYLTNEKTTTKEMTTREYHSIISLCNYFLIAYQSQKLF